MGKDKKNKRKKESLGHHASGIALLEAPPVGRTLPEMARRVNGGEQPSGASRQSSAASASFFDKSSSSSPIYDVYEAVDSSAANQQVSLTRNHSPNITRSSQSLRDHRAVTISPKITRSSQSLTNLTEKPQQPRGALVAARKPPLPGFHSGRMHGAHGAHLYGAHLSVPPSISGVSNQSSQSSLGLRRRTSPLASAVSSQTSVRKRSSLNMASFLPNTRSFLQQRPSTARKSYTFSKSEVWQDETDTIPADTPEEIPSQVYMLDVAKLAVHNLEVERYVAIDPWRHLIGHAWRSTRGGTENWHGGKTGCIFNDPAKLKPPDLKALFDKNRSPNEPNDPNADGGTTAQDGKNKNNQVDHDHKNENNHGNHDKNDHASEDAGEDAGKNNEGRDGDATGGEDKTCKGETSDEGAWPIGPVSAVVSFLLFPQYTIRRSARWQSFCKFWCRCCVPGGGSDGANGGKNMDNNENHSENNENNENASGEREDGGEDRYSFSSGFDYEFDHFVSGTKRHEWPLRVEEKCFSSTD